MNVDNVAGSVNRSSTGCSRLAFQYAKSTFVNRRNLMGMPVLQVDGAFANLMQFGELVLGMTSDGIGTKVEAAERTGIYETLGFDLVAMVVDDLAAMGIEPVNLSNILDVDVLHEPTIDALMRGLAKASEAAGVAVTGGEIAELGKRIGGFGNGMHFNWCATAIGVASSNRPPVDGSRIAPGDVIIALQEHGIRSNGFSLVRKIMEEAVGSRWHSALRKNGKTWGESVLIPSIIYCRLVNVLVAEHVDLHGIAHITGGGVPANLGRILKTKGLGASLSSLFAPPDFVNELCELGGISEFDAYNHWNMGNGMLLLAPAREQERILGMALQAGFTAQVAGEVTTKKNTVEIRGLRSDGSLLYLNPGK